MKRTPKRTPIAKPNKRPAKGTADAVAIVHKLFVKTPEAKRRLRQISDEMSVAQRIYEARTKAGLSQAQLAAKIKTQPSAISRLEDADYDGHSLSVLRRVADALGCRLHVELVPA